MARAWSLVCSLLGSLAGAAACVPGPGPTSPELPREVEVEAGPDALDEPGRAALRATLAAGGPLYWRVRGPDGPRCEAWRATPEPGDPPRGALVHEDGELRLRFAYELAPDGLRLSAPERERERRSIDGMLRTTAVALPCVFSGMSFTPAGAAAPRRVTLTGQERWFLDLARCEAAGPDAEPQPRAPGELHPLGCASALADAGTRARDDLPAATSPALRKLGAARRVFWLRRRGAAVVCEAWSHTPGEAQLGTLSRRSSEGETIYGYSAAADAVTLLGPSERLPAPGGELARARGCLLTRPLALAGADLQVGDDVWFLRRRACEAARAAGMAPQPDPGCGPPR